MYDQRRGSTAAPAPASAAAAASRAYPPPPAPAPSSAAAAAGNRSTSSNQGPVAAYAQMGHYQLGDCLGRGAFGSVFRGLNWMTGETVAVKQIQLGNIPKSELGEIMSEIDLLKNLKHPNIVKYKGSEKTREYLYIILEYCENGSLQHICKRFGKFPEGLVGVYTCQVLDGLLYLHDQGVIHRDIKGANILTTKDGSVKLADFGVATRTGAMADYAVVGSPYWMAPEVIDQSGACTASDIWSVGCVVIELLEGKPPYHQLDPMPALFRIVQDDCPPLPEGASPMVKDFLMHCFQKDANLRVSARKLLRHPWMMTARRQLDAMRTGGSMRGSGQRTVYDEAVKSVQEWNEALRDVPRPVVGRSVDSGTFKPQAQRGGGAAEAQLPQRWPSGSVPGDVSAASQRTPTRRTNRAVSRPMPTLSAGDESNASPGTGTAAAAVKRGDELLNGSSNGGVGAQALATATPSAAVLSPKFTLATPAIRPAAPVATAVLDQRAAIVDAHRPEEQDDNWDDDFEEGISTAKIVGFEKPSVAEAASNEAAGSEEPAAEDNFRTIRPLRNSRNTPPLTQAAFPKPALPVKSSVRNSLPAKAPLPSMPALPAKAAPSKAAELPKQPVKVASQAVPKVVALTAPEERDVEDYSDLVSEDEESHLDERIRKLQAQNSIGRRLFHPNDLKSFSSASNAAASGSSTPTNGSPRALMPQSTSPTVAAALANAYIDRPISPSPLSPPGSRSNSLKLERDEHYKAMRRSLGKYSEGGDEDYSDVFGKPGNDDADFGVPQFGRTLQLTTRLSNRSWLGDEDNGDDPFAEIDEELAGSADQQSNIDRDKQARNAAFVTELVEALRASTPDEELIDTCDQLEVYMLDFPETKLVVLNAHGALAVLQLLETPRARAVISRLLGLLNVLVYHDVAAAQETLCLIGAIPVVLGFISKKHSYEVRVEAAHFIYAMCSTSSLTLQFVLACRGLKALVELIDEDYGEQRQNALIWLGVGCIDSVLRLQSPASRNDFCRMLADEGLLEPLSTLLLSILEEGEDEYTAVAKQQILQTFLIFSSSDTWLKERVATRGVLRRMLQACASLDAQSLTLMLKCIKSLSMSPSILDELQNSNTIETLTRILAQHHDGPYGNEMSNQVLNAMYNLCRLNKSRQEEAAQAGIIPHLLRVVRNKSHLKQFALPILCDFAHAGKVTRKMINQHGGVDVYLELLEDPYWQAQALDAVLVWLQEETARVEDSLLRSTSVAALLGVFTTSQANSFENLLEPFLKIFRLSSNVTLAVGKSPTFIKRLINRLGHSKAVVRLNLLRITKLVCDAHPDRQSLIARYKLLEIIEKLSKDDPAVLVQQLAKEIFEQLQAPPSSSSSPSASLRPHTVRRAASETLFGTSSSSSSSASSSPGSSPRRSPWAQGPTLQPSTTAADANAARTASRSTSGLASSAVNGRLTPAASLLQRQPSEGNLRRQPSEQTLRPNAEGNVRRQPSESNLRTPRRRDGA